MNIPLSSPDITARERSAVMDVLKTPHLSLGPRLGEFERAGARQAGRKYAAAVNSGTSALHLIVKAIGLGRGDRVITTPFSFVASANCLLFEGAAPLFVDIDEDTLNIDPQRIREVLRKRRARPLRAMLPVDVFGHPAAWDELYDIAREYRLEIIEDSCEAIGSVYRSPASAEKRRWPTGAPAGSFGTAGVFAFYPNKQITTGEGGFVLTDSKKVYELAVSLRNQGRGDGSGWFNHVRLGYNYRLSDINCMLGIVQLERLDEILRKRARVADRYSKRLGAISALRVPYVAGNVDISWFVYVVRLAPEFSRKQRDEVMRRLQARGIACSNYFAPIHLQPFYRREFGFKRGDFPVTERVADRTIALPFFANLKRAQIEYVCDNLIEILGSV